MKRTFFRNISANTVQLAINQLLGLLIFYVLSRVLSKADFGELNWTLAIFLMAFTILSFGIDQMIITKIASGGNSASLFSLYLIHVLFTGIVFYSLVWLLRFLLPGFFEQHSILLLLGFGKLMLFFSTPFKQLAIGLERFNLLMYMSVASNIIKGIGLIILAQLGLADFRNVIIVFIAGDITELLTCLLIGQKYMKGSISARFNKTAYSRLLKESLPQFGVVLFSAAIARFDWIFIGLFLSATKLAEYSFAYKVFEVSTLPLLVIAPVLIPLFTRIFKTKESSYDSGDLLLLLRIELIVATLIALMLDMAWAPFIDLVTAERYGQVNLATIFILSLSMPVLYLNNFLWSIHFANGKTKMIFFVFTITFVVAIAGDLILIPLWKNEGAALAYLVAILIQTFLYLRKTDVPIRKSWQILLICIMSGLIAGFMTRYLFKNEWYAIPVSIILYIFFLLLSSQLKKGDWPRFKSIMNW